MNELPYACPNCGGMISQDDVNVAKDIALCRSCSTVLRFSELAEKNSDEELIKNTTLPKGLKVEETKEGLRITYQKLGVFGFFLLFFAFFWNAIVWTILIALFFNEGQTSRNINPDYAPFFLILFVCLGIGIATAALLTIFGKTVITLSPGQGELFRGIGSKGRRWTFVLSKGSTIELDEWGIQKSNGRQAPVYRIAISQPTGKPFTLCSAISNESTLHYICAILRQFRA